MEIVKNDLVQIIDENHGWFPCILVVSEVKSFGVQAYVTLPNQGDAYIRLNRQDYKKVGESLVVHDDSKA